VLILVPFFLFSFLQNIYSNKLQYFSESSFIKQFETLPYDYEASFKNFKFLEIKENYAPYFKKRILTHSIICFKKNKKYFLEAEKRFHVSSQIILSILTIESLCGHHHPKYNIASVYKSLIMLGKNKELQDRLFNEIKKNYPNTSKKWFLRKIKWKSRWAYKQYIALKKIFLKHHIDIFKIKGSWAGAFGLPQFIPLSFLNYAIDGNNDNKIDLEQYPDAIFSIANYLKQNGWSEKLSESKKLKVIYSYNHSKLYCETVLKLSKIFNKQS
jgi:membrane-bound lytic murein transglycosylase B